MITQRLAYNGQTSIWPSSALLAGVLDTLALGRYLISLMYTTSGKKIREEKVKEDEEDEEENEDEDGDGDGVMRYVAACIDRLPNHQLKAVRSVGQQVFEVLSGSTVYAP